MVRKRQHSRLFVQALLQWNATGNLREMPWKREKDPYKIWVSEIILQQTRVNQGMSYYYNFLQRFPNVQSLAGAPQEQVYKVWQGLGYYSRCKHMVMAARQIMADFQGNFPSNYRDIRLLKGVGDYTAAAIASFAYGLPHAVVDGNVTRLLARYFQINTPVDTAAGKKQFYQLANWLLGNNESAIYNQAIMDFGATVCKPRNPNCSHCPLREKCGAYCSDKVNQLPVKRKKINYRHRYFNYLVLRCGAGIYFQKRKSRDIWQNLFEPYLIEDDQLMNTKQLLRHHEYKALASKNNFNILNISPKYSQKLTHQHIHACFIEAEAADNFNHDELKALSQKELKTQYPLPKIIHRFLKDKNYL